MEVARGEYYVFLDSDDAIHPRLLELALKEQASHPQSLITWRFTSDPDLWDQPELDFSDYTTTSYPRQRLLAYFANRTLFNSADNKLYPRDFILEHDLWFDPEAAYHEIMCSSPPSGRHFSTAGPRATSARSTCPCISITAAT